jgi:hypothetical protein
MPPGQNANSMMIHAVRHATFTSLSLADMRPYHEATRQPDPPRRRYRGKTALHLGKGRATMPHDLNSQPSSSDRSSVMFDRILWRRQTQSLKQDHRRLAAEFAAVGNDLDSGRYHL